ncbi:uncharacterized protein EV154DRAFT_454303 [Mucor mucedo]|uniref:uncharacterized protein n=1 Tax=Mucor mucedo TaxID=29922 RepID=UPI00221EFEAC|nr:uncharacterized protein EV154DRAFT_217011 [Mucor mucedo]XP_051450003.1 uncharacterized protein EV154DRAFT_454403 [Mucor mucedo]XP_051450138.1 uncharacterized protein EV154DRAFT_454303 [Mucor mucedo]KAI7862971.1 hypothetical protein EV154DRAFT_217011 [Mucor mucedo]KAI7864220.1 hypothetical protein EV154DRAFT_454403 [Mucor mucedo]KAI7865049.1 hypothetical protein EV154DRAFT_454303 [Mucor mucedo]
MGHKNLSRAVFRPVQDYLIHIPLIIRKQGPLRAYSIRTMERTIRKYSKLIRSNRQSEKNSSNIFEKIALPACVGRVIDECVLNLITTGPYDGESSFVDSPDDTEGSQLWEPF